MRLTLSRMALAVVMAGTLIGAPVMAQAQVAEEIRVDVLLKDADMVAATNMLTKQTGLQFVIENSSEPFQKITLSLTKVSAEDAIR